MAERLAEIDANLVREELEEATHTNEKIPAHIKKVITSPKTMGAFLRVFGSFGLSDNDCN